MVELDVVARQTAHHPNLQHDEETLCGRVFGSVEFNGHTKPKVNKSKEALCFGSVVAQHSTPKVH
jgi:hypothetical protein